MVCQDCTGDVSTTEYIVVDGDGNGKAATQCLNGIDGNVCTLNVAPLPTPTSSPTTQSPVSSEPTGSPSQSPVSSEPTPNPSKTPISSEATASPTVTLTSTPSSSPVSQEQTCLLITTGTGTFDNGFVDVFVDSGAGYVNVTESGINWPAGSEVLNQCYSGLVGVQVSNSVTNAWAGSIETSTDNKITYSAMVCQDCTGDVSTTECIVVDGDGNGKGATQCLNVSMGMFVH